MAAPKKAKTVLSNVWDSLNTNLIKVVLFVKFKWPNVSTAAAAMHEHLTIKLHQSDETPESSR